MRFLDFLFPLRADEAVLRDVSTDDFLSLVAPRLVSETRPGTVALLPFHDKRVRAAFHEAKYHGSAHAFAFLGLALTDYLRDADDIRRPIIVPVPLGRKRQKERGFNQVEEVAKLVEKELKIPIETGLLIRTRETPSQVSLPRHTREENMRGAFKATHSADPACTYILLDDVLTTGATLQAAADALAEAGAAHIIPLALAH
jgi:ComF family protein